MKQDYRCVGGPLDGRTVNLDRDEMPFLSLEIPHLPPSTARTVVTYTVIRDEETGEWWLVWDGDEKANP